MFVSVIEHNVVKAQIWNKDRLSQPHHHHHCTLSAVALPSWSWWGFWAGRRGAADPCVQWAKSRANSWWQCTIAETQRHDTLQQNTHSRTHPQDTAAAVWGWAPRTQTKRRATSTLCIQAVRSSSCLNTWTRWFYRPEVSAGRKERQTGNDSRLLHFWIHRHHQYQCKWAGVVTFWVRVVFKVNAFQALKRALTRPFYLPN